MFRPILIQLAKSLRFELIGWAFNLTCYLLKSDADRAGIYRIDVAELNRVIQRTKEK